MFLLDQKNAYEHENALINFFFHSCHGIYMNMSLTVLID